MPLHILDIIDAEYCRRQRKLPIPVGRMIEDVVTASDADAEFERYARMILQTGNKTRVARRQGINMLSTAFKIDVAKLKTYLKERTICNQAD